MLGFYISFAVASLLGMSFIVYIPIYGYLVCMVGGLRLIWMIGWHYRIVIEVVHLLEGRGIGEVLCVHPFKINMRS